MHRSAILATLTLLVLTGIIFAISPELDLRAARLFMDEARGFVGSTPLGEAVRTVGFQLPFWLLGSTIAGWALARAGFRRLSLPSGRAVAFLVFTLALGPGLVVNGILKDNSHRPRPVQTLELGGPWEFRPWYRFDGQCQRNCSFVSGEASGAFWTLAPALLAPPPIRPAAVGAALVFGAGVATLRMAFGGHYLSDSIFSALLTTLIVLVCHRAFFGRKTAPKPVRNAANRDPDLRGTGAPL